jgi:metal-sulfur cluster biosynthetic enzyme
MRHYGWFRPSASRTWWLSAERREPLSLFHSEFPDVPAHTGLERTMSTAPTAEAIRKAIRAVKDPELNLNIIDIGLVYEVDVDESGSVHVQMTLTSPGCPAGAEIIADVKRVVGDMEGVQSVEVELVWDPYWTPEKMDPRVRTFLGF